LLTAVALAVASCGDDDDSDTSGAASSGDADAKQVDVALLMQGITSYTGPLAKGAEEAAGSATNASIKTFSADQDPATQLRQCQDAIASGKFQAVIVNAVDNVAVVPCVKQAKQAGLTTVSAGSTPVGPDVLTPDIQVSELDGQVYSPLSQDIEVTHDLITEACEQVGEKACNIGWLAAEPAYAYSAKKLAGAKPKLKEAGYNLVGTVKTGFDNPDGARNAVRNLYQAHPEINVIVGDDDSSMQGVVRMKKAGELPDDVLLIGDGGNKAAVQAIKDGSEFATVFYTPRTNGEAAAELAIKLARGEKVDNPNVNAFEIQTPSSGRLTQDNVDEAQAEW
jgi:ABC-type sugar transport system substrate-binding protein